MRNVLELRKNPQYSLAKFSKIYGPIIHLKLGQITTIVISSPDIEQEVLQTHEYKDIVTPQVKPMSIKILLKIL